MDVVTANIKKNKEGYKSLPEQVQKWCFAHISNKVIHRCIIHSCIICIFVLRIKNKKCITACTVEHLMSHYNLSQWDIVSVLMGDTFSRSGK